jgi:hypothetical protein
MGYRRFTDREGATWEVRDVSNAEWELVPVSVPGGRPVRVKAPAYENDPFEVSGEELQRLLDAERPGHGPTARKNPFLD